MKRFLLRIICISFLMIVGTITSQLLANNDAANLAKAQTWTDNTSNQTHFIENKGQIMQTDGQPAVYVSHLLQRGNTNIYLLREGGIAYQFNRMHYPEGYHELMADLKNEHENMEKMQEMQKEIRLETFLMDMHLVDANPNAEIITEGKSHDYTNYYTHDALFVHQYQKITYKNIYPGIDWVIYTTEEGGMKYDFIVQPGADPSVIKMKFTHQEELYLDEKGNLIHGNRLGSFTEKAPISFQEDKSIATQFVLNDNTLSFALENYNPNLPLTIDPARIWGTYYGSNGWDLGRSCTSDGSGYLYLAGVTHSTNNIASSGHQNTLGGSNDAFLVKFNNLGVRQWGTYYGGNNDEDSHFCTTDGSGNVYLAGMTYSANNIGFGGHQNTLGGSNDAFLVKFNSSGVRQWGTYYGSGGWDVAWSCATDSSGNIYLAGHTSSNNIAFGGHQNTHGGASYDAFLVKFNSLGVHQWSTYYGGSSNDKAYSCTIDINGNVYLAGETGSITNIASGGHQNNKGAGSDAFLVKFNSLGIRQWSTYYGGSDMDYGGSCVTDSNGNVYLAGTTKSNNNISSNGHQNTYGGGANDAFLVKFNTSGVRQWGTYYGGSNHDNNHSCTIDSSGNVYMAGTTSSTNNIASDGYQNTLGGDYDAFLVKFNSVGIRQWGTYYGGSDTDNGLVCTIDANGNVYLSGETLSINNIASGGHQNIKSGVGDAFLVKFRTNCHLTDTNVVMACDSFIWIDNNTYTSNNNTATFLILSSTSSGCDSMVTLNLTINNVDVSVTDNSPTLTANTVGAVYQWLNCDNNYLIINGETNQSFTATVNGNYAVVITQNNCTDTSACFNINTIGINEHNKTQMTIYPNPNKGVFTIEMLNNQEHYFEITDLTGKLVYQGKINNILTTVDLSEYENGIYLLKIDEDVVKLIKQ